MSTQNDGPNGAPRPDPHPNPPAMGGAEYFVLAYDTTTMHVIAFTGHGRDFVGAALALTKLVQEHRHQPQVRVRLEAAASVAELWRRDPMLFGRLRFPDSESGQDP